MAWLNATPTKEKESRQKKLEATRTDTYEPPLLQLPEIDPCEHLIDYLFEAGPTSGEHALTWQELRAWREEVGITLSEFEVSTVITLSRVYLAMLFEARDKNCPPPYAVETTAEHKTVVASRLREALHMAANASKTKRKGGKTK